MKKDHTEQTQPLVPLPDKELKRLEPLVGKWRCKSQTKDSILGPGVKVTSTEEFYWLEGGYFLVQRYNTIFGNESPQTGINYWYYDTNKKKFGIIFFSNNGPYTEEGNRYFGKIKGNRLTMDGPARFEYLLDKRGKIAVNMDGTVSVYWWLRDEKGKFQFWMENFFRKIK